MGQCHGKYSYTPDCSISSEHDDVIGTASRRDSQVVLSTLDSMLVLHLLSEIESGNANRYSYFEHETHIRQPPHYLVLRTI